MPYSASGTLSCVTDPSMSWVRSVLSHVVFFGEHRRHSGPSVALVGRLELSSGNLSRLNFTQTENSSLHLRTIRSLDLYSQSSPSNRILRFVVLISIDYRIPLVSEPHHPPSFSHLLPPSHRQQLPQKITSPDRQPPRSIEDKGHQRAGDESRRRQRDEPPGVDPSHHLPVDGPPIAVAEPHADGGACDALRCRDGES